MTELLRVPVYSEQELTPRAIEVIRAITDSVYPHVKYAQWHGGANKVLVFGRAPEGMHGGVEFVYTYSIAQLMSKANAASVLTAALRQFIETPDPIPFEKPQFILPGNLERRLDFNAPTAIDIETSGNLQREDTTDTVDIISVAFYQLGHPPLVVTGMADNENGGTKTLGATRKYLLSEVLPRFTKGIYHNGKFDIRVLNRVLGIKLVNWFDTMLAQHSLNIASGEYGLKPLARRYLGAPEWEGDLKQYLFQGGHYERIPYHMLVQYNGWDVYWTYKLWEFLAPQIEADEDAEKAFYFEMQAADFLLDVEKYGIPLDLDYITEYGDSLDTTMIYLINTIRAVTGNMLFNPNSPQQVKTWLREEGYDVVKTDVETLTELKEVVPTALKVHDFLSCLLQYRKHAKVRGTYVDGWWKRSRGGRVHPTFLVHGTSTGRLSSTNPNSQNVPRDKTIRKIVRSHGNES